MAKNDWTYWTHGVNVVVEFPDKIGIIRRAGWGTLVSQPAKTWNWFHVAIPTANQLDGTETVKHESAFVKVRLNENARITKVHVWVGNRRVIAQEGLDLRGPDVFHQVELAHDQVRDLQGRWAGMVICVFVEFLTGTPAGEVVFEGAGATSEKS